MTSRRSRFTLQEEVTPPNYDSKECSHFQICFEVFRLVLFILMLGFIFASTWKAIDCESCRYVLIFFICSYIAVLISNLLTDCLPLRLKNSYKKEVYHSLTASFFTLIVFGNLLFANQFTEVKIECVSEEKAPQLTLTLEGQASSNLLYKYKDYCIPKNITDQYIKSKRKITGFENDVDYSTTELDYDFTTTNIPELPHLESKKPLKLIPSIDSNHYGNVESSKAYAQVGLFIYFVFLVSIFGEYFCIRKFPELLDDENQNSNGTEIELQRMDSVQHTPLPTPTRMANRAFNSILKTVRFREDNPSESASESGGNIVSTVADVHASQSDSVASTSTSTRSPLKGVLKKSPSKDPIRTSPVIDSPRRTLNLDVSPIFSLPELGESPTRDSSTSTEETNPTPEGTISEIHSAESITGIGISTGIQNSTGIEDHAVEITNFGTDSHSSIKSAIEHIKDDCQFDPSEKKISNPDTIKKAVSSSVLLDSIETFKQSISESDQASPVEGLTGSSESKDNERPRSCP